MARAGADDKDGGSFAYDVSFCPHEPARTSNEKPVLDGASSSCGVNAQGKSSPWHGASRPFDCQQQLVPREDLQGVLEDLSCKVAALSEQRNKDQAHILELHARVLELERQLQALIYLSDASEKVSGTTRRGDTPQGGSMAQVAEQVAHFQTKVEEAQGHTEARVADVEAEVGASTKNLKEHNAYLDARIAALEAHFHHAKEMPSE